MQPDPYPSKNYNCPIQNQINQYRNSLPQIPRTQNHFFFKQINHQLYELAYVTIGFKVGVVPFELMDLFAVIINQIHCNVDANFKLVIDGEQLWVTSTMGFAIQEVDTLRYNMQQAHTSEALQKTQNLLKNFLNQLNKAQKREQDKKILQRIRKQLSKNITQIFKNPYIDD